jgi:prolipoprotein diacylglyceryltransferase
VSLAVIAFDFDPYLISGWRRAVGDARDRGAIFFGIALARSAPGRWAPRRRSPVRRSASSGAVVGGRLGYVFLHPAYFTGHPGAILDPAVGSLELGLAVVGGAITGGIVAALLDGNVGRWFHVSALPVLLVIGAGKLSMVLGGTGQGQPWTGSFATAYLGDGPWGSLAPALPSHPSQAYEGIATLAVLVVLMGVLAVPGLRRPDGRAFLISVGLWAVARSVIVTTWRDPVTFGPFRTEQVIALLIAIACLIGFVGLIRREARRRPRWRRGNLSVRGRRRARTNAAARTMRGPTMTQVAGPDRPDPAPLRRRDPARRSASTTGSAGAPSRAPRVAAAPSTTRRPASSRSRSTSPRSKRSTPRCARRPMRSRRGGRRRSRSGPRSCSRSGTSSTSTAPTSRRC